MAASAGFCAGHVIEQLLAKGYTVHGTVRDPSDAKKTAFLRDMDDRLPGTLRLFQSDLMGEDPFTEAFRGCWGVLHLASAVARTSDDPMDTIRPAVRGTLKALESAKVAGMRVVVVTSSTASVGPTHAKRDNKPGTDPYTVLDHNDVARLDFGTYAYSKIMAESDGRKWVDNHLGADGKPPFRYVTVHFPWATGPQQNARVTSSNQLIMLMMTGKLPALLPMSLHITDVRDVARAHVHCLLDPRAHGRYIVAPEPTAGVRSTAQMAALISEAVPEAPVPRFAMPLWLARILVASGYNRNLDDYMYTGMSHGAGPGYRSNMAELGFVYKYLDADASIRSVATSMKAHGIGAEAGNPALKLSVAAVALLACLLALRRCCGGGSCSAEGKSKTS